MRAVASAQCPARLLRLLRFRLGFRDFVDQVFRILRLHPLVTGHQLLIVVIALFGDLLAGHVDLFDNFVDHSSSLQFDCTPLVMGRNRQCFTTMRRFACCGMVPRRQSNFRADRFGKG